MGTRYYLVRIWTKETQLFLEELVTTGPYESMDKDKVFSLITVAPPEECLPLYYQVEEVDKVTGIFTSDQLKKRFRNRKYEESKTKEEEEKDD